MSREAERITAEYLMRQVPEEELQELQFRAESVLRQHKASRELHCKIEAEPLPTFLNSKRLEDNPDRVSPLEAVAGFAVVALFFVLIFWGIA